MRFVSIIVIVALAALLLGACAAPEAPATPATPDIVQTTPAATPWGVDFTRYEDDGVVFEYPADWGSVPSPIAGAITFAAPVARGTFAASVSIVTQDPGIRLSFEQFKQFAAMQYEQMDATYTSSEITLHDKSALYYEILLPPAYGNGMALKMVQYVLQKDSAFYVLAMMETEAAFASREALFDYMGQSFDVE